MLVMDKYLFFCFLWVIILYIVVRPCPWAEGTFGTQGISPWSKPHASNDIKKKKKKINGECVLNAVVNHEAFSMSKSTKINCKR